MGLAVVVAGGVVVRVAVGVRQPLYDGCSDVTQASFQLLSAHDLASNGGTLNGTLADVATYRYDAVDVVRQTLRGRLLESARNERYYYSHYYLPLPSYSSSQCSYSVPQIVG